MQTNQSTSVDDESSKINANGKDIVLFDEKIDIRSDGEDSQDTKQNLIQDYKDIKENRPEEFTQSENTDISKSSSNNLFNILKEMCAIKEKRMLILNDNESVQIDNDKISWYVVKNTSRATIKVNQSDYDSNNIGNSLTG